MSRAVADLATRQRSGKWRLADREDTATHSVYRLYDAEGELLYIGCAADVASRVYMHLHTATTLAWFDIQTRYDHHTSQEYPTKAAARAAERQAIADEAPLLNRQHNPKRWRRVGLGQYVPASTT